LSLTTISFGVSVSYDAFALSVEKQNECNWVIGLFAMRDGSAYNQRRRAGAAAEREMASDNDCF
jgi:hypothetical protein